MKTVIELPGYTKIKMVYVTDQVLTRWAHIANLLGQDSDFAEAVHILVPTDNVRWGREHYVRCLFTLRDAGILPEDAKLSNVTIMVDPVPVLAYVLDLDLDLPLKAPHTN